MPRSLRLASPMVMLHEGIDVSRATGTDLLTPYWLSLLASAYGRIGQAVDGLIIVDEALGEVARTSEWLWESARNRLKGDLLLQVDAANEREAEACFLGAIETAKSQAAKTWDLRSATSLAKLWHQQGKATEARALLEPVYSWFTEGLELPAVRNARTMLDE